jgi:thiol-disulfide isomerase/thioredoxin
MVRIASFRFGRRPFAAALCVCAIMAIIGVRSSAVASADRPALSGDLASFSWASSAQPAPTTGFTDEKGNVRTLKEFRGRVVLVNFWATWCAPCVREMPSLERLQAKLGGPDFTVIALSEDRSGWQKIGPFRDKMGLKALPLFHDVSSGAMFAVKASSLPTTIIYDRDGKEVGRMARPAEWDSPDALALIRYFIARK